MQKREVKRQLAPLLHLAFLVHRSAATRQEDVEALAQRIKSGGVRSHLRRYLLIDRHGRGVDHVDYSWVLYGNIEPRRAVIVLDGIWGTRNRYLCQFATRRGLQRHDTASITGDERPTALLVEV